MNDAYIGEPMTVARLREELAQFPGDMPVVTTRDEEGNGFCNFLQVQVDTEVGGAVIIWPSLYDEETPQTAVAAAAELWTERGGK